MVTFLPVRASSRAAIRPAAPAPTIRKWVRGGFPRKRFFRNTAYDRLKSCNPVCACSLVSSLLLSGATMSQQSSLTQSAHSVRQVLTAYSQDYWGPFWTVEHIE